MASGELRIPIAAVKVGKHRRPKVGLGKPCWWRLEPFKHRESGGWATCRGRSGPTLYDGRADGF